MNLCRSCRYRTVVSEQFVSVTKSVDYCLKHKRTDYVHGHDAHITCQSARESETHCGHDGADYKPGD